MGRLEVLMKLAFKLKGIGYFDLSEQFQIKRVTGLEIALTLLDVLRHPDLDRRASVFIFANEIDRQVISPRPSTEPVEQHFDHFFVRVGDNVERKVFLPHKRD